jgi:transposase
VKRPFYRCLDCKERQREIDRLQQFNAQLGQRNRVLIARTRQLQTQLQHERALRAAAEDRIKQLEERVSANASNTHLPPSANPPGAPPATVKKPTGRKRGAQVGHRGHYRKLIPSEQADERIEHRPTACERCRANLQGQPGVLVGRHQVAELPVRAVRITEHQSFECSCPECGAINRGKIPDAVRASVTGERLGAAIGLLSARVHGSRRAVAQAVAELLGSPIALGSVIARERELTRALSGAHNQLVDEVAASAVKYVDETGWQLKGRDVWLLTAATKNAAVFQIEMTRTRPSLKALLGDKLRGTFCTDRAGIYDILPAHRRGLCWAHLKRDFLRCAQRGGPSGPPGNAGLEICKSVFSLWRDFRARRITRRRLQQKIAPLQKRMHQVLVSGEATGVKKTAGLCRHLLAREQSLWRFAFVPGLEPTNNLAERMLRPAVIWRKKSFGCDSKRGCRYVGRMLSVIQTLKLRGLNALDYLAGALKAHRQGEVPAPIPPANPQK